MSVGVIPRMVGSFRLTGSQQQHCGKSTYTAAYNNSPYTRTGAAGRITFPAFEDFHFTPQFPR